MSGICGIFSPRDPSRARPEHLERMLAAIAHRGPAARRRFFDPSVGILLGHLFMAAFLPGHHPRPHPRPHWRQQSEQVIAMDGAVFGEPPLAPDPGTSDDVLRVAERRGADPDAFPAGVDGHFALAVWDGERRRLEIARDGLGQQPLYYAHDPDRGLFVFASELAGVLAHPEIRREVDPAALTTFLTFGYVPAPHAIVSGARKVFPGEILRVGEDGVPVSRRFWRPPPFRPATGSLASFADELGRRITRSVEKQLGGDERPGLFLSGGLDSTALLCAMRRLGVEPRAFTLGFEGGGPMRRQMDDLECARRVAAAFAIPHHPIAVGADHDPRALFPATLAMMDEPMVTPSLYSKRLLADAAAARGVTGCLSGSNGGISYERFAPEKLRKLRAKAGSDRLEALILAFRNRFVPCEAQGGLLAVEAPEAREVALETIARYAEGLESDEVADLLFVVPMVMQGAEKGIAAQCRASIPSGVALRFPHYDPELIAWVHTVPARHKGSESSAEHKAVLRRAFPEMPEEVVRRDVIGFASQYWTHGELGGLCERLLAPESLARTGLLDPAAVARLVEEDRASTRKSAGKRIWGLAMLQAWVELHVLRDDRFLEAMEAPADRA